MTSRVSLPEIALVAFAFLNLVTFAVFGFDKMRSQGRNSRVPERVLLWLTAIGGTAGAYSGRAAFQHKTRKQPFVLRLHAIAACQAAVLLLLTWWLAHWSGS